MAKDKEQTQIEHVEVVPVQVTALEAMERATIDVQIATAKQYPRSLEKFYRTAEEMIALDQDTAASCMYNRPVGKEAGKMRYAEGMSIRLAEIVAASYNNLRVAGLITEMTSRYVKAIGIAHDLEGNYAVKAEVVESTVKSTGVPFSERMRVVVAKAAQSKAIRDAIFRVVPKSVCKRLSEKAKIVARGDAKTFEEWRKNVIEWIQGLKIKPARVWAAIDVEGAADIGYPQLELLGGLKTAIKDGDITIDEAFPPLESDEPAGKTTSRIKDKFAKPKEPAPEPKKTSKKKAAETKPKEDSPEGGAPGSQPESPVNEEQQEAPPLPEPESAHEPAPAPEPEPEAPHKWKCGRCDRTMAELANGKCPFCFGECTTLN